MGLDYLNKKVWHPGSMKNIQKVWEAQQARLQVVKKDKERKKKLQDEKHNEEMKRIQVEAGLIPRSHLQRMDWMYDWGNKVQQQKNSQEYLTGDKKPGKKEVKHIFQEEATNKKCQDFILLHEDPMYEIIKEQMKQKELLMNNPIEMKNIIREVQDDYLLIHPEEKKKKHKKQKKEKKKKRRRNRSDSSEGSENRKRKRSQSFSNRSERQRSRQKKSSKQSELYQDYLKNKFGSILSKDQEGNLKPDYNMHRKKYRTQFQMEEEEAQRRRNELRMNARKLKEMRGSECEVSSNEQKEDYNEGVARIRKEMFDKKMQGERRRY